MPFTIKVLDSEEVNAFALPGGFFFVNSGLIIKADRGCVPPADAAWIHPYPFEFR